MRAPMNLIVENLTFSGDAVTARMVFIGFDALYPEGNLRRGGRRYSP